MIFINSPLIFSIMLKGSKKSYRTHILFITNRNFSSSNYLCIEKNYLKETLSSNIKLNSTTPESKDSIKNKVDSNNSTTSKIKNTDSLNVRYELDKVNYGFFSRFHLSIKNYSRAIIIGVKKGISTPTLPPKLLNLLGQPLIRIFRMLGNICMFICVTNKLSYFNKFLQLTICIIFILNIFFSIYISVVRIKNIKKLIKDGTFDVRNSR